MAPGKDSELLRFPMRSTCHRGRQAMMICTWCCPCVIFPSPHNSSQLDIMAVLLKRQALTDHEDKVFGALLQASEKLPGGVGASLGRQGT